MNINILKIMCVVGARPNFMKIAPIIDAIKQWNTETSPPKAKVLQHILVHTGQHYDTVMSEQFFDELEIPRPDVNLEVGSLSHAEQTAEIMKRFEPVLKAEEPDCVLVVGDVNSTVACALVCAKIQYTSGRRIRPLIVHVEAGLRSFDRSMPEEVNRVLTDAISDILFTTEESATGNLKREGIPEQRIYFVGNVMIDTLQRHRQKAEQSSILGRLGLDHRNPADKVPAGSHQVSTNKPYAILTLHRPSNVDDQSTFSQILETVLALNNHFRLVYPIHPRSLGRIKAFGLASSFDWSFYDADGQIRTAETSDHDLILAIPPLGYIDFLHLMAHAGLVLTDSGGIQEETTILGVPCITLRENTERPITVTKGTNIIAGTQKDKIIEAAFKQMQAVKDGHSRHVPPLWDGHAARRIIDILAGLM